MGDSEGVILNGELVQGQSVNAAYVSFVLVNEVNALTHCVEPVNKFDEFDEVDEFDDFSEFGEKVNDVDFNLILSFLIIWLYIADYWQLVAAKSNNTLKHKKERKFAAG